MEKVMLERLEAQIRFLKKDVLRLRGERFIEREYFRMFQKLLNDDRDNGTSHIITFLSAVYGPSADLTNPFVAAINSRRENFERAYKEKKPKSAAL